MTAVNNKTGQIADVTIADVTLVNRLQGFTACLNRKEAAIFRTIVESAALHAQAVQANDEGSEEAAYSKPKAVPINCAIKEELIGLPAKLFA